MIQTGILILLIGVSNVTAGVYKRKCCNPQQMARYLTVNTFSQTISEKHLPSLNDGVVHLRIIAYLVARLKSPQ